MMLWVFLLVYSIVLLTQYRSVISSIGLLIDATVPLVFFMQLFTINKPRTTRTLMFPTLLIFLGFGIVIANSVVTHGDVSYVFLCLLSLGAWVQYVFWYSNLGRRKNAQLHVGKTLPELSFINTLGEEVSAAAFPGKKFIYLFYRGNWCPLCMAQIKEITQGYRRIMSLEVEVFLISPQPLEFSKKLAAKMEVPFHFLTDSNNGMARKLGIQQRDGIPFGFELKGYDRETVLPTVIITDENSTILYVDQTDNYRIRPEPETFLEVLRNKSERKEAGLNPL